MSLPTYKTQDQLMPKDLLGISNEQISDHWKLYQGYVNQVNALNTELEKLAAQNQMASLAYSDRRRRRGFEYNGMVLHEYYFGNLKAGDTEPSSGEILRGIINSFGSYKTWKEDFESAGKTRGIGWAILYADPIGGALTNHFIAEHEDGNVAGFQPILVMDVWEHAYMVDHEAGGRANYIAAFMQNINWEKVAERLAALRDGKVASRW